MSLKYEPSSEPLHISALSYPPVFKHALARRTLVEDDRLRVGWPSGFLDSSHSPGCERLVRSQLERRCSNLGPTQSRVSPGMILEYTKIIQES